MQHIDIYIFIYNYVDLFNVYIFPACLIFAKSLIFVPNLLLARFLLHSEWYETNNNGLPFTAGRNRWEKRP